MQSAPDTRRWLRTGAAPPPGLRRNTAASPPHAFSRLPPPRPTREHLFARSDRWQARRQVWSDIREHGVTCQCSWNHRRERHAVRSACVPGAPARAGAREQPWSRERLVCTRLYSVWFVFLWGLEEGALRDKQFLTKNVCTVDQNLLKNKSPTFLGDLSKSILCSELPINLRGFRPVPLLLKYIFIILLQLCCSSYK